MGWGWKNWARLLLAAGLVWLGLFLVGWAMVESGWVR
jgi:hypothetical protein